MFILIAYFICRNNFSSRVKMTADCHTGVLFSYGHKLNSDPALDRCTLSPRTVGILCLSYYEYTCTELNPDYLGQELTADGRRKGLFATTRFAHACLALSTTYSNGSRSAVRTVYASFVSGPRTAERAA